MTRLLRVHPRAESDLAEIWAYTAKTWSRHQADRYLLGLDDTFGLLRDQPELARLQSKTTPQVRIYRHGAHIVIFTAEAQFIEIIRVAHAKSNWWAFLAD